MRINNSIYQLSINSVHEQQITRIDRDISDTFLAKSEFMTFNQDVAQI